MQVVTDTEPSKRHLDPISRISEVLFGLIMALTFTSTISAATAGRQEVRMLMFAAIGCNVAWGLVDAVMFLMNALTERGRGLVTVRTVRAATSPKQASRIIADSLPTVVAGLLSSDDYERLRRGVLQMPNLPDRPTLNKEDWLGAASVFVLVVLSTFPVVVPFLVIPSVHLALRTSNGVAVVMLFAAGFLLARYGGYRPWLTGFSMVGLGLVLVALTVALGG